MVDVDARLAEIEARAEMLTAQKGIGFAARRIAREDVPWLLAVLKEQADQIERLQREATETVARGGDDRTPDVRDCPECEDGTKGNYDGRVTLGFRGIFTCPVCGTRWQDADETPTTTKCIPVARSGGEA